MNSRFSIRFPSMLIAAGLIVAVTGASAQAGFVTWQYAGQVTSVQDDNNLLGGAVGEGSPFSGTFTFDPDASAIEAPIYREAIMDATGMVESIPFSGPTDFLNSILVLNDFPSSGFDNYSMQASVHLLGRDLVATISLRDNEGGMLTSDALLSIPPPFELIDNAGFTLSSILEDFTVIGKVTGVHLVPEPATFGMLAIGTLALLRRKPCNASQRLHTRKKRSKTLFPLVETS